MNGFLFSPGPSDTVICIMNSGGASLYGFYNEQSLKAPPDRLDRTPAGCSVALASADMPAVDGIVFVAPYLGQGLVLQNCIDPAVADTADPRSVLPELNFPDPANGYVEADRDTMPACLFIEYTGDNVVFPADAERAFAIASPDKQRLRFRGDHNGQPLAPGEASGRALAGNAVRGWLGMRFA